MFSGILFKVNIALLESDSIIVCVWVFICNFGYEGCSFGEELHLLKKNSRAKLNFVSLIEIMESDVTTTYPISVSALVLVSVLLYIIRSVSISIGCKIHDGIVDYFHGIMMLNLVFKSCSNLYNL